jgi:predicted acylesterase/phospholipase RssA
MAHIGVLKALEDNGIVVDLIAGTSAGAMTGIVHAAGFSPNWADLPPRTIPVLNLEYPTSQASRFLN